jgi:UDP-N-acetylmuramoyl-tripeptide--D-alanyl-D-alanine ligase
MIRSLLSLYSLHYPKALLYMLQSSEFSIGTYLKWYWRTNDFSRLIKHRALVFSDTTQKLLTIVRIGIVVQILAGLVLLFLWANNDLTGGWQFGLAVLISYPIVWAHLLVLIIALRWLTRPKALGRAIVCSILEAQVRRLRARHSFSVVAVVGSVGKTSTKIAIARVLQATRKVQWQEGNYNDRVTVPLIFFGHNQPNILNIAAWLKIFIANERIINKPYPYQVVVAELGTDGPGFMKEFAYVKPDLVVVTAIAPEHMEYFGTIDTVAREELAALNFSRQALVNIDDVAAEYLHDRNFLPYSTLSSARYHITERHEKGMHGQLVTFHLDDTSFTVQIPLLGVQGAKIALAAASAAHIIGLTPHEVEEGVANVAAFAGRMQILPGIKNSTIIDDTYNAAPIAVKAALDVLYGGDAPQRIAILGSMNELGDYTPDAHREVAEHCDPAKLDWVITIGSDAKKYLAPVAKKLGCQTKTFLSPYKAGEFVKKQLQEGAVVLAKGSQNGVFAEEAIKGLLANKEDESKLVRQSDYWMNIKRKQFKP